MAGSALSVADVTEGAVPISLWGAWCLKPDPVCGDLNYVAKSVETPERIGIVDEDRHIVRVLTMPPERP